MKLITSLMLLMNVLEAVGGGGGTIFWTILGGNLRDFRGESWVPNCSRKSLLPLSRSNVTNPRGNQLIANDNF